MATVSETNTTLLERFLEEGTIAVQRSALFEEAPPALIRSQIGDRVEGMLLGLAIGDALGNTSEGLTPQMRAMSHGEIRSYLPNRRARGREVGLPSDDTQLAFWTIEQLLEDDGLVPENLATRFSTEAIVGIGGTVGDFVHRFRDLEQPWYEAGPRSAGNGALMRIAPILLPHLREPSPALWADTALAAMVTHNDPASTAACLALVRTLWSLLGMSSPPEPEWWIESYGETMRELEGDTEYRPRTLRGFYEGPVWEFALSEAAGALREERSVGDACEEWLSGAYLLETVPSVLYILARCAHDPEEAIVRAVNDTIDNDTIAAVVGASVGALHGRAALPERWIDGLLGRTRERDDGRVFELIEQVQERWVRA